MKATVLWRTAWRPDQKDVEQREAAAAQGMARFFSETRCFQTTSLARTDAGPSSQYRPGRKEPERLFTITWRDGGPGVVKGVKTLPDDLASALRAGLQAR